MCTHAPQESKGTEVSDAGQGSAPDAEVEDAGETRGQAAAHVPAQVRVRVKRGLTFGKHALVKRPIVWRKRPVRGLSYGKRVLVKRPMMWQKSPVNGGA